MTKLRPIQLLYVFLIVLLASSLPAWAQDQGGGPKASDPHYKILHNFQGQPDANGNFDPEDIRGLASDGAGTIYGESLLGGSLTCALPFNGVCLVAFENGAEFKLDRHGAFTSFPNPSTEDGPLNGSLGPMLFDPTGNPLFATISGGANGQGGVFTLNPETGGFTTLFSFSGTPVDGSFPGVNVVRDAQGNLYGTTLGGHGPIANFDELCFSVFEGEANGCGTVYKLDAETHQETILHTFNFTDGNQPIGLAIDKSGNLFGAVAGGDDVSCNLDFTGLSFGCGLIFEIDALGNFSIIHEFHHTRPACFPFKTCPTPVPLASVPGPLKSASSASGTPPEVLGWSPQLIAVDDSGNIFGTTGGGGNFGLGVIFKIDATGQYTVLHHFAGPGDGFFTEQLLVRDGKLYGIPQEGGNTLDCDFGGNGCGTVFVLDTNTAEYKVLHTFSKNEQGTTPSALAFDERGDLIGANLFGGIGSFDTTICTGGGGCGNVFRLKLSDRGDDDE